MRRCALVCLIFGVACEPNSSSSDEPIVAEPPAAQAPASPQPAPAPEPTPSPAPGEAIAAPEPSPAPEPILSTPDPWEVHVEGVDVEVRELVAPKRSYEANGRTLSWFVRDLVADDTSLWLAEQAAYRGHSGLELEEPGARITRWSWDGGAPEILNADPLHEIVVLAAFGDELVFAEHDVFTDFTRLVRLPRAGGAFEHVTGFHGREHMILSSDGKRLELPNRDKTVDPRTGKLRKLRKSKAQPDLSRCVGIDPDLGPFDVQVLDGHALWVVADEVRRGLFKTSRGVDGRLRHCSLADGSVHTLAKLRARWLNPKYAWTGTQLVFALDGGVYAVELPGGD